MEIERKFRVTNLDSLPSLGNGVRIEEGFLAIEPGEFGAEVRIERHHLGSVRECYMTRKKGDDVRRRKRTISIPGITFQELWPSCGQKKIFKMRYTVALPAQTIRDEEGEPQEKVFTAQVDIYEGALRGLVIVEVEFTERAEAHYFKPPAWFGQEVSRDRKYREKNLARHGLKDTTHDDIVP